MQTMKYTLAVSGWLLSLLFSTPFHSELETRRSECDFFTYCFLSESFHCAQERGRRRRVHDSVSYCVASVKHYFLMGVHKSSNHQEEI